MNRTGIEWTDFTWNPITGCSGCEILKVCYARKLAYRFAGRFGYPKDEPFRPTWHADRMMAPNRIKNPSRIFVCSMGELFDPNLCAGATQTVLKTCAYFERHTFQVLTKRPELAKFFFIPKNVWVGVSVCRTKDLHRIDQLRDIKASIRFVSFEPLLENMTSSTLTKLDLTGVDWIIIGAQTNPYLAPHPNWVYELMCAARYYGCAVFMKDNLGELSFHKPREFPDEMDIPKLVQLELVEQ